MGRTKSSTSGSGNGNKSSTEIVPANGAVSPASGDSSNASSHSISENKIKDLLKVLHKQCFQVQEERNRGEHSLQNIAKTHDRLQQEQKVTPYYKTKLKSLYTTAMQDAMAEADVLRAALQTITEIQTLRDQKSLEAAGGPKPIIRRGVLMNMLVQNAVSLPLWVSKPGEKPPPLCGAVPADPNYICAKHEKVAAKVRSNDGEENWILAMVQGYNPSTKTYDIEDIDADDGREHYTVSRKRVLPLPVWKANPETDPEALFPKGTLVLALYPQTTCFYRAVVEEPPKGPHLEYSVLFEDTSYDEGYSPPLMVAQRYLIAWKDDKKK